VAAVHTQASPLLLIRLCSHSHFHRIINDQIHELIESLAHVVSLITCCKERKGSYSNLSLYPECQLLVEPNRNRRSLLQKLEDEVNWRKQRLASTSTACSAGHDGHATWKIVKRT
jgi:hypothetical protein